MITVLEVVSIVCQFCFILKVWMLEVDSKIAHASFITLEPDAIWMSLPHPNIDPKVEIAFVPLLEQSTLNGLFSL